MRYTEDGRVRERERNGQTGREVIEKDIGGERKRERGDVRYRERMCVCEREREIEREGGRERDREREAKER